MRCLHNGADSFSDEQALEMLLFCVLPRIDTKPVARALLTHFGSFVDVLEASPSELTEVHGVGKKTAALLVSMLPLFRRYELSRLNRHEPEGLIDRLLAETSALMLDAKAERVILFGLDEQDHILERFVLPEGSHDSYDLNAEELLNAFHQKRTTAVAVVHSHPSGRLEASGADVAFGRSLERLLEQKGRSLRMNLIWADGHLLMLSSPS